MDVVFHHDEAVGAREGGDLAAPALGHDARGGVLERGDAIEGLGAAAPAGGVEGVGPQAVLVHGHALEPQVEQSGQGLHAGIRQRLGEHEVAGPEQRAEDRRHAVLAPAGDEDAVRCRLDARAADPRRAGRPMRGRAAVGRVAEEPVEVPAAREGGEGAGQAGAAFLVRVPGRQVRAEVDGDIGLGRGLRRGPARESAPADLARDQTAPRGFGVRPGDGAHRQPQAVGQLGWVGRRVPVGSRPRAVSSARASDMAR